jgi:cell division initiation protein
MDVSPKTLREVEFREKMRGYHPEDVDQFLERVAAGIEVLQERHRQALERAQRAEQAAAEAGGNDEALRRTLVLAQRTADLAVQEAREQAARILSGAEQQAQAIISDAEDRSKKLHEDALVEAKNELSKLESARQQLQTDVDNLTRWVEENRSSLRSTVEEALNRLDHAELLGPPPLSRPLELTGVSMGGNGSPVMREAREARERDVAPERSDGPPTVAWHPVDEEADEDPDADPYFAELRRAVNETGPLGPRHDPDPSGSAGAEPPSDGYSDEDFLDGRRLGTRLRRRR